MGIKHTTLFTSAKELGKEVILMCYEKVIYGRALLNHIDKI